jgi:ankyrin repeat protein
MRLVFAFAKSASLLFCCTFIGALLSLQALGQKEENCVAVRTGSPSALVKAVQTNDIGEFQRLIAAGADVNEFHYASQTALMEAVSYRRVELLKTLIAAGADVNKKNPVGWTALIYAAQSDNAEIVQLLIDAKAETDVQENTFGGTALLWAARDGNLKTIDLLLNAGANLYQKDKRGNTAFLLAAEGGKVENVRKFLELGFDPNSYSDGGYTALSKAAQYPEVLKALIAAGAKVDLQIEHFGLKSCTALYAAAQNGYAESVKVLIKAGANVNIPDFDGRTPLNRALVGKHAAAVELLRAAGAKEIAKEKNDEQ